MGPALSSNSNCFYKMHAIWNYGARVQATIVLGFSIALTHSHLLSSNNFQLPLLVLQILEEHCYFYQPKDFQQWLFRKTIYRTDRRGFLVIQQWCRVNSFCIKIWLFYLLPVIWGQQLGIFYQISGINKVRSCLLWFRRWVSTLLFFIIACNKLRKI